jgi:hypothetical protein
MLLSIPTWIIHLLSVSEWLAAILLLYRYAVRIGRPRLQLFAFAMVPHLLGGTAILAFHASGDQATWILAIARLLTFCGSLCLLCATLLLLRSERNARGRWAPLARAAPEVFLILGLAVGLARLQSDGIGGLLPVTNALYLGFLILLLVAYRQDPMLFSPLSLFGFWFLLVFVAVTVATTQVATQRLGLPSLAHADLLHGGSEALLSVSNFLIALGVHRRLRALRRVPAVAGPATDATQGAS